MHWRVRHGRGWGGGESVCACPDVESLPPEAVALTDTTKKDRRDVRTAAAAGSCLLLLLSPAPARPSRPLQLQPHASLPDFLPCTLPMRMAD
eukprot:130446-Chlamydomonas_euryale.AAC.1